MRIMIYWCVAPCAITILLRLFTPLYGSVSPCRKWCPGIAQCRGAAPLPALPPPPAARACYAPTAPCRSCPPQLITGAASMPSGAPRGSAQQAETYAGGKPAFRARPLRATCLSAKRVLYEPMPESERPNIRVRPPEPRQQPDISRPYTRNTLPVAVIAVARSQHVHAVHAVEAACRCAKRACVQRACPARRAAC